MTRTSKLQTALTTTPRQLNVNVAFSFHTSSYVHDIVQRENSFFRFLESIFVYQNKNIDLAGISIVSNRYLVIQVSHLFVFRTSMLFLQLFV